MWTETKGQKELKEVEEEVNLFSAEREGVREDLIVIG